MDSRAWVADVGGTSVKVAVVDRAGVILAQERLPSADLAEPEAAWEVLVRTWRRLDPGATPAGAALALPAQVTDAGEITFIPNLAGWTGSNPRTWLEKALSVPVYTRFDSQAALLGEAWLGEAVPMSFYFLAIGTGIGGAYQIDGHPARGAHNLAGVPASVRVPCSTGHHIEDIASGRAVAQRLGLPDGRAAVAAARAGDRAALGVFADAAQALQEAVSIISGLLDVHEVRLGGGFGIAAFDLLFPETVLNRDVRTYPPIHDDLKIRPATTGVSAQLLGLAATVLRP
ncbi:MAG: ROK family protein [Propionibacteriaceae bacterium]|nr:ROK family protein [Propionibacteriaceae bacterium]